MIDPGHPRLSIVRQCELVSIGRSSFYREAMPESAENLVLMRLIDEQFLETPWYGSRQMARHLRRNGWCVGRHRVRRLMTRMGLAPIYQQPKTSEPHPRHKIYPYLLRHLAIDRPNQVWCADITYILVAIAQIRVRVPQCLRDRQRRKVQDRALDRILQRRTSALGSRRQDARRGLCYAGKRREIGGVIEPRIHLSQAAILFRKPGPPQFREVQSPGRSPATPNIMPKMIGSSV
jgi:transposase InsO family protein